MVKGIGEKTIQRIRETLLTKDSGKKFCPDHPKRDINYFKNKVICGDNVEILRQFPNDCIDLTVTSPPYDNLRTYNGFEWDFEALAKELYRVTRDGGVVVWVVGDATINGSETGASFRQALYFKDVVGFNLHDTMIYQKLNPMPKNNKRYEPAFEYMFVLSKGTLRAWNPIKETSKFAGKINSGTQYDVDGVLREKWGNGKPYKKQKVKNNIWGYSVGGQKVGHPAIFPEQLAHDHIISWSNKGDVVLDPFGGSGTTAKMALLNNRHYIYIDCSEEYNLIAEQRIKDVLNKKGGESNRKTIRSRKAIPG